MNSNTYPPPALTTDLILLIARVLVAPIMIVYGLQKLGDISAFMDNPATERMMQTLAGGHQPPLWFAYANALFQMLSGVFVLLGVYTRISAWLVLLWLIPVTYFGHPFWAGIKPDFNEAQFYKNLAIMAAYALLGHFGGGRLSVERWLRRGK